MPSIFISYRRSDSQADAGRIYDRLSNYFGREAVFKDVDDIPAGADFRVFLNHTLNECKVLLAIIGPSWLSAVDKQGSRRLDNPSDWVRLEIEEALRREDVLVVPVLVSHAQMPKADELPESLENLAYRNYREARPDPDFNKDMKRLIIGLEQHFEQIRQLSQPPLETFMEANNKQLEQYRNDETDAAKLRSQPAVEMRFAGARLSKSGQGGQQYSHSEGSGSLLNPIISPLSKPSKSYPITSSALISRQQFLKWGWLGGISLITTFGISQVVRKTPIFYYYNSLERLLKAGSWKEADQETLRLILKIANREAEGYPEQDGFQSFPCDALRKIDQLWVNASDGKFGFSIQARIYEECGGKLGQALSEDVLPALRCFEDKVGWRIRDEFGNSKIINFNRVIFDKSAPAGHLPFGGSCGEEENGTISSCFMYSLSVISIFSRVESCGF